MTAGTRWRPTSPRQGDLIAGLSVALVLVPQSLAYAELAGLPPVHGLYAAAAAPLAAALVGSSPYLQTGPVALTSLLTFGALATMAPAGTAEFAAYAALLAIVVGAVRLLLGLLRWGVVAYLMSQPVVTSFTVAAAILIVASQVPALVDVPSNADNPLVGAFDALSQPSSWDPVAILIGVATIGTVILGRRLGPRFPGVLIASLVALGLSTWGILDLTEVGDIPSGVPPLDLDLPWDSLASLVVPGVVIALVGFAEPASISRKYASEERRPWDPDREFVGQGLANVAAGLFSGYPAGGSFSRSALNRLSGARTRWSGAVTGLVVLAVLPLASVLSSLPKAVLAGLVIAAVLSLLEARSFQDYWRYSRSQFGVAVVTFSVTLAAAPHVERGVLVGVGLALGLHLWREMRLDVEVELEGDVLHVHPHGVLYFVSAPVLEQRVQELLAEHAGVRRVVLHLHRLGRADLTGVLVLRSLVEDARSIGADVTVRGVPPHAVRVVTAVLPDAISAPEAGGGTVPGPGDDRGQPVPITVGDPPTSRPGSRAETRPRSPGGPPERE